jgi:murein DD-endopeptidase MepM/ murein hydrolase activator NlpD
MQKKKRTGLWLTIFAIIVLVGALGWFLMGVFEGEKPTVNFHPLPRFLTGGQKFTLAVSDMKRGLKKLDVLVMQEGREIKILEKKFPFKGLFNEEGTYKFETEFSIHPSKLNLTQGRADLQVRVWDYSRRSGGDGNLSLVLHKMAVDTVPPAIRVMSRLHYINEGGTGLIVYQTSSDAVKSGVFVNDLFFKGFTIDKESKEGLHIAYFAIPVDIKPNPEVYVWAKDRAGNLTRAGFYHRIRRKRFRTVKVNITDRFLKKILPFFSYYDFKPGESDIEKFLQINGDLRKKNGQTLYDLQKKTAPEKLWDGVWLRQKNAASMAGFGEHRVYYYKGKVVDKQTHLGQDLASLANSDVSAVNNGRVVFAGRLGIYGLTVALDHGQGLTSVYSHLSKINVTLNQDVAKGEVVGVTGQTGLAGGDHLHLSVMVGGVFVNPIEWWDSHWIRDNITRKLAIIKK